MQNGDGGVDSERDFDFDWDNDSSIEISNQNHSLSLSFGLKSLNLLGTLNQMKAMKTFLTEATTSSLRRYWQYSKIFYRYRLSWWNKFWTEKYKIKLFIRVTGIKLTYNWKVFVETSTTDLVVYISRPPSAQCFISLVYASLSLTVNIILTTNP